MSLIPSRPVDHTAFSAGYATELSLGLTEPPLDCDQQQWTTPVAYQTIPTLAENARNLAYGVHFARQSPICANWRNLSGRPPEQSRLIDANMLDHCRTDGAGKTTFALQFLPSIANCNNFVNADLIAAGLSPLAPERELITASRLFLQEIKTYIVKRQDFGFETTLAGKSYL